MSWPTLAEYDEAVQNLRTTAGDEELREGSAATGTLGRQLIWSGNFAGVWKIGCPHSGNTWALKCFIRETPGLRDRYREISTHLSRVKLPFTVDFTYLERGIRVHGEWFPALKMQWVEGLTLDQFVKDHLERPRMLKQLLGLWVKLAARLMLACNRPLEEAPLLDEILSGGEVHPLTRNEEATVEAILADQQPAPSSTVRTVSAVTELGGAGRWWFSQPSRSDEGSLLAVARTVGDASTGTAPMRPSDSLEPVSSGLQQFITFHNIIGAIAALGLLVCLAGLLIPKLLLFGAVILACSSAWWIVSLANSPLTRVMERRSQVYATALRGLHQLNERRQSVTEHYADVSRTVRDDYKNLKSELANLDATLRVRKRQLRHEAEERQRQAFLVSHEIRDAVIPGIGSERTGMLVTHGIRTAYDVNWSDVSAVPGFGVALTAAVVAWREAIEQDFRFFPDDPILAADIHSLETQTLKRRQTLTTILNNIPARLGSLEAARVNDLAPILRALHETKLDVERAREDLAIFVKSSGIHGRILNGLFSTALYPLTRALFAFGRWGDRLIARAVGEENTIVRNFLGVFVPLVFALTVGLIAKTVLFTNHELPLEMSLGGEELSLDLGNGVTLDMVLIPAGSFTMGDDSGGSDEKPAHRVRITKPFYLGKYEVTQEQWQAVMGDNPSNFKGPKNPVEEVSWDDCQGFLAKLNAKHAGTGRQFTLPTEAQWEYACRAGSTTQFSFGDDEASLDEYAWFSDNSDSQTHPVGQKKANAWNLYDMHGNVWEWCQDRYDSGYYANSPTNDPSGPALGSNRVNRGGGWCNYARSCRSASRDGYSPGYRLNYLGFRLASVPVDASSSR